MRIMLGATVLAVTSLAPIGRTARAQPVVALAGGDRVRVTWCEEAGGRCEIRRRADGRLLGHDGTGLRLTAGHESLHVPWHSVRRLETHRGSHGALRTVLFGVGGLVLGGLTGVVIGTVVQGDCYELECLEGPVYGLLIGAPTGLIAGVSVAVGTRERWVTAYQPSGRLGPPQDIPGMGRQVAIGITIPVGW